MSRCKACNTELSGMNQSYMRTVRLENGSCISVMEDLCLQCRAAIHRYSSPDDFDLIDGLGMDVDDGGFEEV